MEKKASEGILGRKKKFKSKAWLQKIENKGGTSEQIEDTQIEAKTVFKNKAKSLLYITIHIIYYIYMYIINNIDLQIPFYVKLSDIWDIFSNLIRHIVTKAY